MQAIQLFGTWSWQETLLILAVAPLAFLHLVVLMFLPALLAYPKVNPKELGKAVYVYVLLTCSVLLILGGAFPVFLSLFSLQLFALQEYGSLVLLIGSGVAVIFVLSKRLCKHIDPAAAALPRAAYFCTFYVLGALLSIGGALTFAIAMVNTMGIEQFYQPISWWVVPTSLIVTGGGVLLFFRYASEGAFAAMCEK